MICFQAVQTLASFRQVSGPSHGRLERCETGTLIHQSDPAPVFRTHVTGSDEVLCYSFLRPSFFSKPLCPMRPVEVKDFSGQSYALEPTERATAYHPFFCIWGFQKLTTTCGQRSASWLRRRGGKECVMSRDIVFKQGEHSSLGEKKKVPIQNLPFVGSRGPRVGSDGPDRAARRFV